MGLLLDRLKQIELAKESEVTNESSNDNSEHDFQRPSPVKATSRKCRTEFKFLDLEAMPPELSLQVLKNLNATDLCLAACVWTSLANDDVLWQSLCRSTWGHATVYMKANSSGGGGEDTKRFRSIFMHLDEATLTFNVDWRKGLEYLFRENLVANDSMEIAKFINSTNKLNPLQKQKLFNEK